MANSSSISTSSGGIGGLMSVGGYPGQLSGSPYISYPLPQVCSCGKPATRVFYNPKGISLTLGPTIEANLVSIYLCDACDFRHTVMRAAGRGDEFLDEYNAKQAELQAKQLAEHNRLMDEQMKAEAYHKQDQVSAQQTYFSGLTGISQQGMNTQQSPEESWINKVKSMFGGEGK